MSAIVLLVVGVTALIASHDLSLCAEYGERIVLVAGGKVQAAGRPEEVITEEHILAAFGVRVVCDRNPATGTVRVTPVRREAGNTIRPGEREDR